MQLLLDQLITQALDELAKMGMTKSTIKSYQYSAFNPVRNYYRQHATERYEPAILASFLAFQRKRQENHEISKRHYRQLRKAVQMLEDIHQYGTLQCNRHSEAKYKTNEEFSDYLQMFLESQSVSKGTLAHIRSNIRHFLCYLESYGHRDFGRLLPIDVVDYLSVAAESHSGSMGNVIYSLRLFLSYLKEKLSLPSDFNPVLDKPAQRKKRILPCFTHEEVEVILSKINRDTRMGKRDYAIIFLASHTGLRAIDIANLKLTDLNWDNDTIQIVQRKTGRSLILPLEADTGNAIVEYILGGRPESDSDYVFLRTIAPFQKLSDVRSVGNILEKYRRMAGINKRAGDGISFHALRRSIGTWMLESEVPLTTISQVLGHKEQDSTKQYLSADHQRLAACALDFQGIPLKRGTYQ